MSKLSCDDQNEEDKDMKNPIEDSMDDTTEGPTQGPGNNSSNTSNGTAWWIDSRDPVSTYSGTILVYVKHTCYIKYTCLKMVKL